jgi:Uma2 family endonuclease
MAEVNTGRCYASAGVQADLQALLFPVLNGRSRDEIRAAFLALPEPDDSPGYELEEDGRVTKKVAPRPRHSTLQAELLFRFRAAQTSRIAQAYPELRIVWPNILAVSIPDIAVYRWERRPIGPDRMPLDEATQPPDLAIEIRSPDQTSASQLGKCMAHVERGTRLALLLDPEQETAHLVTAEDALAPRALRSDERLDLAGLLPDPPTVAELFGAMTSEP